MSQLLGRNGSEDGVEGEIKTGSLFDLQGSFVGNVFKDHSESDYIVVILRSR